ncbi:hypothetical protein Poli38472_011963 [Pythium oligandrum]|uniref:ubiquitinyl hydrolase 1 n=1 Tax=Pythium oligandrum TaxID=41045 RepID=A0A8K1CNK0_PYTOL|nr:hypothetical protein Poli38472_011963 [Pythium oligandrum]|eukprot:TMW66847.1 hypothetical protein Poli38472_011963 [Pythium oligandrum]
MASTVYHEKQSLLRCGIHALNNLLQAPAVDTVVMDAACEELVAMDPTATPSALTTWLWHPHRAPLGLGNYDVNVLMLVLQQRGFSMQWTDKRQRVTRETIDLDAIEGVLCNVVTFGGWFRRVLEQRHWFALRKINGVVYSLDSKLPAPMPFTDDDACRQFLQELLDTGECELFAVTRVQPEQTTVKEEAKEE